MQEDFTKTVQELKSVRLQMLDLQAKEHALWNKMLSQIDKACFENLRTNEKNDTEA